METMFWVWLAVIAISLIIEIVTLDLVSVWFACGAIIPFILSAIGGIYIELQIAVFIIVTALLFIFVRKYAQKLLFRNMNTKTNVDSLIGKHFRLLEETDFEHMGSVKVNDVTWTATSESGEKIEKGSLVEVVKIEGNKLIVKKVDGVTIETKNEKVEAEIVNEENKNISNEPENDKKGNQKKGNQNSDDDKKGE